jgi:hypothetical protein
VKSLFAGAAAMAPGAALAHAFGERYELPVPVWLFVAGGALTVTLTFALLAAFARAGAERFAGLPWSLPLGAANGRRGGVLAALLRALGVAALCVVLVAGFFGSTDPNRNIAPTLVWIVWWIGFSYVAMLAGNAWPLVNPWRTLFDWSGARPGPHAPPSEWVAVAGLLVFGWVELVFPFRAVPSALAGLVVAYSVVTWAGMARYGAQAWLENADPFHRLFALLSRFAPLACLPGRGWVLRPYAAGLLARNERATSNADVAFIVAMLAIVLFDGFQGSKHWVAIEDAVHALNPKLGDGAWMALHTAGLLAMWLAFVALYLAACAAARGLAGGGTVLGYARAFAPTLIPIAVGYQFAHTFTYLLVQGQSLASLASDPLGLGWDLFGTRDHAIDITIIGTKTAWYLALSAIVIGHAISVLLADVAAGRLLAERGRALRALAPMTLLMVIYTIVSLQILAEPLVRYSGPQETII